MEIISFSVDQLNECTEQTFQPMWRSAYIAEG